ncbi:LacI family DNA-binding transcriptional regulator [Luteimicrobium subarcticum]|uniref:LacI family transcriptional regulator n=1 Tax=Luteimicrobium subarcticum TaxID=620910 RepID=A0A2M8WRM7_9MICO|nr:LacI family DNA-binding transcriptional regulator [Luteimicrobium subarcticum]PJI93581.1 LacI family transcriptional regulator [Luteimicrobium subarcticum]
MDQGAAPPGRPRATLTDVARVAGVSAKTVSRVFSGGPVSDETRRRVEAAAASLRFRPNHLARDLRSGGTAATLGFVIGRVTNPFYAQVAAGVERVAAEHGLTLLLAASEDDPATERRCTASMLAQRVRALLLVPAGDDQSYLSPDAEAGTPMVCVDRPGQGLDADSVVLANREGAAAAVRSLTAAGHRRVAFVASPGDVHTHRERLAGYRDALREAGVVDTARWERLVPTPDLLEEAVHGLVRRPDAPTAFLAGNGRASAAVLRALGPSSDRAVIGFDDLDLADVLGLTVVAFDAVALGEQAARLALARVREPDRPTEHVVVPTRLVRRGSGERPPRTGA